MRRRKTAHFKTDVEDAKGETQPPHSTVLTTRDFRDSINTREIKQKKRSTDFVLRLVQYETVLLKVFASARKKIPGSRERGLLIG
jgi:hypothetical protein